MAFKDWPLVRDARFAQKCGRYLHGARKRRPDLNWPEFLRIARYFKLEDMGSLLERGYLFQLAQELPANARVVEVGSWLGASTCYLAAGMKDESSRILAVDNFKGDATCGEDRAWYRRHFQKMGIEGTLEIFRENLAALALGSRVEPVVSDSLAAAAALTAARHPCDLIFVDGDHAYEACRADIAAWAPLVKPGGIMAFHDFGSRADGVTRAIFEAIKSGRFTEIIGVAGTVIAFRV